MRSLQTLTGPAHPFIKCLLLLVACGQAAGQEVGMMPPRSDFADTVVVADPRDPYFPLAVEISRAEILATQPDIEQALARQPRFLLWVGSPGYFSDRRLVQAGRALKEHRLITAVGIISGRTQEDARALWKRRTEVQGSRAFAVNGEYPPARIMRGRILTSGRLTAGRMDLSRDELIRVLQAADYLTFTGHGGGSYWKLAQGAFLTAADFPRVPPALIATASCDGLRLNSDSSLALASVAQGAAGYAGFWFSPIEGYLVGEFDGLPLRSTWAGVTAGEVIQLQNRGAMQGFAAFPSYFLLGDPRIRLQPVESWSPIHIESTGGVRTCNYGEAPPGFLPVRIRGGAQYHFVEVPGTAAASDDDLFYNARLQILNQGGDKLVLLLHPGGELKIRMQAEAPLFWRLTDPVLDALDHTVLFLPATGGAWFPLVAILLASLGIFGLLRGEEGSARLLMRSSLAGIVLGIGQTLYVMARIDVASITSKPLGIGPFEIVMTATLGTCGMALFLTSATPVRRLSGIAVAVFPGLCAAGLSFAVAFGFNTVFARPALGTGLYNYSMPGIALLGTACHAAVFTVLALLFRWRRTPDPQ